MKKEENIRTIIVIPDSLEARVMKNELRWDEKMFITKAGEKPNWNDLEEDIVENIKEIYNKYLYENGETGKTEHKIKIIGIDITGKPNWIENDNYKSLNSSKYLSVTGRANEYVRNYLETDKDNAIDKISGNLKESDFGDYLKDKYIYEWFKENNLDSNYLKVTFNVTGTFKTRKNGEEYIMPLTIKNMRKTFRRLEWRVYDDERDGSYDSDLGHVGLNETKVNRLIYVDSNKKEIDITNIFKGDFTNIHVKLMNYLDKGANKKIDSLVEKGCKQKAAEFYESIQKLDNNIKEAAKKDPLIPALSDLLKSHNVEKTLKGINKEVSDAYFWGRR